MDELFYRVFESLPRQGPGDFNSLQKAYEKLKLLPPNPDILDIGCGTGCQTMMLASISGGNITAVDNHEPFIKTLEKNILKAGYKDRVKCIVGDMKILDFAEESFDVVWCEGAVFIMGVGNALSAWRRFLRRDGYAAISELVWFKKEAPKEIRDFFKYEYPEINYYTDIFPIIESAGYKEIEYFPLPGSSWWDDYYTPMIKKIEEISPAHAGDKKAEEIFNMLHREIDMHRKYSEFYGYGFYIMRKG